MLGRPLRLASGALMLVLAACGGEASDVLGIPETTAGSTSTTEAAPSTTAGPTTTSTGAETTTTATTTTVPESTATTEVESVLDVALEAIPTGQPAPGTGRLLGEAPDATAAQVLTAELEDLGLDPAGIGIWVWPIGGTGDALLILEIDDRAAALADNPEVGELLLPTLLASPTLETAGVSRVVINYRGSDDEGPFTFTTTYPLDVVQTALRDGTDLPEEEALYQLTRG